MVPYNYHNYKKAFVSFFSVTINRWLTRLVRRRVSNSRVIGSGEIELTQSINVSPSMFPSKLAIWRKLAIFRLRIKVGWID